MVEKNHGYDVISYFRKTKNCDNETHQDSCTILIMFNS